MSFTDYEREVREHLAGMLGGGGFDSGRDILAITVNRWPHGYSYDSQGNVKTDVMLQSNVRKVFACGDMQRGQSLIVWAISEGRLFSFFYYPLAVDFWHGAGSTAEPPGICIPFLPPAQVSSPSPQSLIIAGEVLDPVFENNSSFKILMIPKFRNPLSYMKFLTVSCTEKC